MSHQNSLVPIWLDWSGRTVLVIGLGQVGQRRALTFQQAGATVVGVDPLPKNAGPTWGELIRGGLELRAEPYHPSIFEELAQLQMRPDLVLASANASVNQRVERDAKNLGLWVASATSSETDSQANAHLGTVAQGRHLAIAVHSGNVAPALSKAIRDQLQQDLIPAADRIAAEAARWRPLILTQIPEPDRRRQLLAIFGSPEFIMLEQQSSGAGLEMIRTAIKNQSDLHLPDSADQSDQR